MTNEQSCKARLLFHREWRADLPVLDVQTKRVVFIADDWHYTGTVVSGHLDPRTQGKTAVIHNSEEKQTLL